MRLLFKCVASNIKFVPLSLAANILDVADERISRLRQRDLFSVVGAVVPSISEKNIDVEIILSAISFCTGVKTMDP